LFRVDDLMSNNDFFNSIEFRLTDFGAALTRGDTERFFNGYPTRFRDDGGVTICLPAEDKVAVKYDITDNVQTVTIFDKKALCKFIELVDSKGLSPSQDDARCNITLEMSIPEHEQFKLIRSVMSISRHSAVSIKNYSPNLSFKVDLMIGFGISSTNLSRTPMDVKIVKTRSKPIRIVAASPSRANGVSFLMFHEMEKIPLSETFGEEFFSFNTLIFDSVFYGIELATNVFEHSSIITCIVYELMFLLSENVSSKFNKFMLDVRRFIVRRILESGHFKENISSLRDRYRVFSLSRSGYPILLPTWRAIYVQASNEFVFGVLDALKDKYLMNSQPVGIMDGTKGGYMKGNGTILMRAKNEFGGKEIELRHACGGELPNSASRLSVLTGVNGRWLARDEMTHGLVKDMVIAVHGSGRLRGAVLKKEGFTLNVSHGGHLKANSVAPKYYGLVFNRFWELGFSISSTKASEKLINERRSIGLSTNNMVMLFSKRVRDSPFNIDINVFGVPAFLTRADKINKFNITTSLGLGRLVNDFCDTDAKLDALLRAMQKVNAKYMNEVFYSRCNVK